MSSGTKCGHVGCKVLTEGVVTGRVRLLSSRSGQALYLLRIAEIPLQGLTSAVALVLCIHVSLSCLVTMNGGVFFPPRKGVLCVQKMGRNGRSRDNRGTAFAYYERLPSAKLGWVKTRGTHQSGPGPEGARLRQSRHHCGRDRGIFVSNRQVD